MTTDNKTCIHACNKLLRGEISAIETYSQALGKLDNPGDKAILQQIMKDHQESAATLRDHVSEMGGVPDSESGAWGTFAKAVEGAAALFGKSPAVAALIQGEQHGINEYEEALHDPDVMPEIKVVFRETLIPRLKTHIAVLEGLPS